MTDAHDRDHDRRYASPAERLRAPARLALLEVPRVVGMCLEGITAARVLDVGTGTGIFAEAFAERGVEVTGVDPNPGLLSHARGHVPGAQFQEGVAEKLPFDDRSFDLVFLGHVLHETDDRHAALTEARRVARLRVAILEWPYIEEKQGPPLGHRLQPAEIVSLIEAAGFAGQESFTLSHMHLYLLTPRAHELH
ncbi:MAG: class I SAM-dependent methyltransferase [Spirochaetia bacterium]|jgi:ubiquinone/menaquinone biosynthesis C-methylase UbiE